MPVGSAGSRARVHWREGNELARQALGGDMIVRWDEPQAVGGDKGEVAAGDEMVWDPPSWDQQCPATEPEKPEKWGQLQEQMPVPLKGLVENGSWDHNQIENPGGLECHSHCDRAVSWILSGAAVDEAKVTGVQTGMVDEAEERQPVVGGCVGESQEERKGGDGDGVAVGVVVDDGEYGSLGVDGAGI